MTAAEVEIPWDEVDRLARRLAEGLGGAASGVERVVGVARGGLIPAVLVAGHLAVRRVEAVQVRHYEGRRRLTQPVVLGDGLAAAGPSGDGARTVVVDDVYESGGTFRALRVVLPRARFVVLVAKTAQAAPGARGCLEVSPPGAPAILAAHVTPVERWVVFPWSDPGEAGEVNARRDAASDPGGAPS